MKEIVIVGTIHLNWTPKEELEKVLADLKPDKVLVELSPDELEQGEKESIRDEMFAAYNWAVDNGVAVAVFDVDDVSGLKEGVTGKEPEFVEHELKCKDLLRGHSWQDLNKVEPWQIAEVATLEKEIEDKYFDKEQSRQREMKMLANVKSELIEGKNVIVTGTGHLTFFKEQLPDSQLPFRN